MSLGRAGGDDGDPRQMRLVRDLSNGQALDVIAAAREHADHPREHAGLVVDQNREGVGLLLAFAVAEE